jgi:ubiquitin conjugation factor E4 B
MSEQNNTRPTPRKTTLPPENESIESYENKTLSSIFRITLDPKQKVDSANHKLIHLPNLQQELEDEGVPVMLTKDRLDSAIMEAASTIPNNKSVLDYLLPCWKRVNKVPFIRPVKLLINVSSTNKYKALKALRGYASAKDVILKEAKRLCMSNMVFAAEVPELFG